MQGSHHLHFIEQASAFQAVGRESGGTCGQGRLASGNGHGWYVQHGPSVTFSFEGTIMPSVTFYVREYEYSDIVNYSTILQSYSK